MKILLSLDFFGFVCGVCMYVHLIVIDILYVRKVNMYTLAIMEKKTEWKKYLKKIYIKVFFSSLEKQKKKDKNKNKNVSPQRKFPSPYHFHILPIFFFLSLSHLLINQRKSVMSVSGT